MNNEADGQADADKGHLADKRHPSEHPSDYGGG
jgi:hypothetical protein